MRWRLTASYALVVLAAAAAVSIAATGFALARGTRDVGQESIAALLTKDAAAASRFMSAGSTPPPSLLRYQIVLPAFQDVSGRGSGQRAVAILDRRGRLLVADSCSQTDYTGPVCAHNALALLAPLLADPLTQRVFARARHGRPGTGAVAGRSFAVAPILAAGKHPVGALVAAFAGALPTAPTQSAFERFWSEWEATLPRDWFWLVALSILLGTAVGAILSHRLVGRLTRITDVVRVWSQGNLTATADARRRDELGRLAGGLNQMAEQLRNLLDARSELATQQERRRVQRDLHDGIKQELFATSMQLATARASVPAGSDTLAAALDHAQGACRRAQHELSTLLEQTPPRSDLVTALTDLATRTGGETDVAVACEVEPGPPLPDRVEEAIYRIAQEALANARRHSNATEITLTLARNGTSTCLRITDNGHGFAPGQTATGMGLQTMRERVDALGGRLEVRSTSAGTTIEAALPAHEQ